MFKTNLTNLASVPTNPRTPLPPPRAIKGCATLMGMPPAFRNDVIAALFEGVTISLSLPHEKQISLEDHRQHRLAGPKNYTRLVLARVNKEFKEEVYRYVFAQKRVKIKCDSIQTVECLHPDAHTGADLFKQVKMLSTSGFEFRVLDAGFGNGPAAYAEVFPNLELLAIDSTYYWDGSFEWVPSREESIVGFFCRNYADGMAIRTVGRMQSEEAFTAIFSIEFYLHGKQILHAAIERESLKIHSIGIGSRQLWTQGMHRWHDLE